MKPWAAVPVPLLPGHGLPVRVHDTATGALRTAAPGTTARLYVCGITPYDATHLGHAATYLAFDLLGRAWRDAGQQVRYVQNVTDVDDPLLERAAATGEDWRALADRESALFATDMAALRVLPPDVWVGAVEAIPRIVTAVEAMLAGGGAYRLGAAGADSAAGADGADGAGGEERVGEGSGDVYAAVSADDGFGRVAHLGAAVARAVFAERGGDPDRPGKCDPLDALLWRAERAGEPAWDGASLGPGRPGWHVECAVIARDHLGGDFDVQGGGSDLVFPHHEMSASHDHVLHGGAFARTYAHAGMVGLDGVKMSKSLGNLVLVSRLRAEGVDPMAVRLAVLAHHYRHDWSWTAHGLVQAQERLARWRGATGATGRAGEPPQQDPAALEVLAAVRERLADDLDAPGALDAVDAWAGARGEGSRPGGALVARTVDALLGVDLSDPPD